MKIALMWPDYWPYIRRGTERMMHDVAVFLAGHGDDVDIITTKPGRPLVRKDGRIQVIYQRQISHPVLLQRRWAPRFDFYGLTSMRPLLAKRYDLIYLMIYTAGPAVRLVKRRWGTPYIYHVLMIPPHWGRLGDEWLFRLTMEGAAQVRVFSQYSTEHLAQHYGRRGVVIQPTVDTEAFRPAPKPAERRILFTGDLKAPKKGAALLGLAFGRVHRERPDTVLQYSGPTDPTTDQFIMSFVDARARGAVQMLGVGTLEDLHTLYSEAAVVVLPSQGELFGMVLIEALASGTPVVGTNSGGIPEIITDPAIGELFEFAEEDPFGNADRLAEAILHVLDLSDDPQTVERCRAHAAQWTWSAVGARFLELQDLAISGHPPDGVRQKVDSALAQERRSGKQW